MLESHEVSLAGSPTTVLVTSGPRQLAALMPQQSISIATAGVPGPPGAPGAPGAPGTGQINTAANDNVGGVGVFKNTVGDTLHFYGISSSNGRITVNLDGANSRIDLDIASNAIANSHLADMPAMTLLGNNTGAPADPIYLTAAQSKALLAITQADVASLVSDLALKAPLASPALTGNPTAPTQAALNNSTRIATTAYVDAATTAIIAAADVMVFKGVIDCSANPNYPAADRGWTYRVSVAGKIGGASGINVEIGDLLLCLTDGTASGNQATVGSAWSIAQTNVDGAVIGPASAVDGTPAVFDGATGKLLKNFTFATFKTALAIAQADVAGLTTASNPEFASVNIGHATDTTITRVSAGLIAVEGSNLLRASDIASDADIRAANAGDKPIKAASLESASAFVALTINTTPAPDEVTTNGTILDWDAFINATLTHTANMTLINPSNGQPGTWRTIAFTQHTSPVTITLGSQYKSMVGAGLPVSTGSGKKDLITIFCRSASEFWIYLNKDML